MSNIYLHPACIYQNQIQAVQACTGRIAVLRGNKVVLVLIPLYPGLVHGRRDRRPTLPRTLQERISRWLS